MTMSNQFVTNTDYRRQLNGVIGVSAWQMVYETPN